MTRKTIVAALALAIAATAASASGANASASRRPGMPAELPTLRINDIQTAEGDSGTHAITFLVKLSAPSDKTVSAALDTVDGTAKESKDYFGTSTTLYFPPGRTKVKLKIRIIGDTSLEGNEWFIGYLSTPVNATIKKNTGTVTIVDDD